MRVVHRHWAAQTYGEKMSISDSDGKVVFEGIKPEDCTDEVLKKLIEEKQREAKK